VFLSAGALALVWPPLSWTWLGWVALVPFLFAIERAGTTLRATAQGLWLSVSFGALTLWPIATAFGSYQDVGASGGFFAAAGAAFVFQLSWPIFAGLRHRWPRSGWPAGLGAAALFASLDAIVPKPFGDTLGLAFYEHAWLRQCADLGGPWVLTFGIVAVNEAVLRVFAAGPEGVRTQRATLGAAAVVVGSILAYGALREAEWSMREAGAPGRLSVAIVQGNVPLEVRRTAATGDDPASEEVLDTYLSATRAALGDGRVDLVVWPETTYPGLFRQPFTESQARRNLAVDRFVQQHRQPLLFGSYTGATVGGEPVQYNSVVALTPGSDPSRPPDARVYEKRELLPFGETVPLLGDGPTVRAWFPHVSWFGRGPGPAVLPLELGGERVRLGPTVCYEDLFVRIPLAEVALGAEVLVNVSHDGWFGPGLVRPFHLAHAVFRSVEARRPQIRAATSGISAIVSATGELVATGEASTRTVVRGQVPTGITGRSPLAVTGSALAPLIGLLAALGGFVRGRRRSAVTADR